MAPPKFIKLNHIVLARGMSPSKIEYPHYPGQVMRILANGIRVKWITAAGGCWSEYVEDIPFDRVIEFNGVNVDNLYRNHLKDSERGNFIDCIAIANKIERKVKAEEKIQEEKRKEKRKEKRNDSFKIERRKKKGNLNNQQTRRSLQVCAKKIKQICCLYLL